MTTATPGVLIVGRSPLVLETTLALLSERGYDAHATSDFGDITGQFDAAELDVVVLGGQVPPDRKAEMREALRAVNPRLAVVQGLAGIPGLLVDQVEATVAGETAVPGQAPVYDAEQRAIELVLFAPLEVEVTVYWITELVPPNPKSASAILVQGALRAGEHRVRVPDAVALDAAFATVVAGAASWSFRLTPPAG
ncbi:hypothetical protein DSM104299_02087 [Baekduia alba]|uniref:hypothetical protein n=1 Tax=Baekduia alba TaxID=2997333 RepID=UPI002341A99F|nr:hypothetical protein [Baekduia alba]WCB93374.1 hypothetical protein DSM104299_02087 [Baekduia alba]